MKPTRLLPLIAIVAVACQSDRPLGSRPEKVSADISDGAHCVGTGVPCVLGNPHFYWLPPMTKQPSFTGTFNPGLAPVVEIRELFRSGFTCTDRSIATFTTTSGPGGETVKADAANKFYSVNWRTKDFNLNPDCTYRIRALVSGVELGLADVDVVATGTDLKRVDTGEFVPLLDDRTLPIKLRIEEGAVFFASTGDDACRAGRDCAEAIVTGGQDATVLTDQKLAGVFIPANALSSGRQISVTIEQRTTRPCIPTAELALPQFDDCYRYVAVPLGGSADARSIGGAAATGEINPPFRFDRDVTVGMCVEVGALTTDQARHLDIFRFEPTPLEGMPRVTSLPDAPATFLPCDTGGLGSPGGIGSILRRGWQVVTRTLFGPQTAYAGSSMVHLGLGGSSCCLSYFTWGLPADVRINDGNNQTVAPGGTLPTAPSVIVRDSGGGAVVGAPVAFSVASGNGSITGPVVTTGTDGIARVGSWTLPSTPATYALTATLPGAGGTPVTFSATAASGVQIASVNLAATSLPIDGPGVSYSAVISNGTTATLTGVFIQAYIDQGEGASRAAGGGPDASCGTVPGQLPPGSCNYPFGVSASNTSAGSGTLVPGNATARFTLIQGATVLDVFTVPVSLINPPVGITSAGLSPTTLPIGGLEGTATVSVDNTTGALAEGLVVEGWIRQGPVRQTAGQSGDPFSCAAGTTCSRSFNFVASSTPPGLHCGSAEAEFDLKQAGSFLHLFIIPITLSSAGPCP